MVSSVELTAAPLEAAPRPVLAIALVSAFWSDRLAPAAVVVLGATPAVVIAPPLAAAAPPAPPGVAALAVDAPAAADAPADVDAPPVAVAATVTAAVLKDALVVAAVVPELTCSSAVDCEPPAVPPDVLT